MSFEGALEGLMFDEVTIEPFISETSARVPSYGAAVTYKAQVIPASERVIDVRGRELRSMAKVIVPERIAVDVRSRLTLPSGFVPNQPPIIGVRPYKGLGLDATEILMGGG